jgi:hypothetical protein
MKKKLFALSGVFLIVLVVKGLWATRATDLMGVLQQNDPVATSLANEMTMEELTEGASLIIIGECKVTRSRWVERRLVTDATILVTEKLKGGVDAGTEVTVELPGGIDSNRAVPVAMSYAGAPQISPNEKVFLFLDGPDNGANSYSVIGFSQGKFSIGNDNAGEEVVTRDRTMVPMERGAGPIRGNRQAVRLSEFRQRVRELLN